MTATAVQVKCVTTADRNSSHEGISILGGDGWTRTRQQVIELIETKANSFYTKSGASVAWIYVRQGRNGKFLQTYADGKWSNNLLALPRCR